MSKITLYEKAQRYARNVTEGREPTTKEVIKQCSWFLQDVCKQEEDDFKYYMDHKKLKIVEGLLKLMNFATGLGVVGKSIFDGLEDFQAFFIVNVFGWRFKENPQKSRYRDITLFIPRKNAKTFLCALIVIILMLIEQKYSEFYSICLDRELAGEVKKAIKQILEASPYVGKRFKVPESLKGQIKCKLTNSFFQPRTAEANRNNAIRPAVVIADEIGAFTSYKNIAAMKSGQLNVPNPLIFKLTTAYAEDRSIMLDELEYMKKIYAGLIKNERMFALLYYAPPEHLWDDIGLYMSNPLRIEENYDEIRDTRALAREKPKEKEEYLTKHMNHFVPSNSGQAYINIEDVKKCKVDEIDWAGRNVWVGIDLATTTDNCAFSICTEINGEIYADSIAFIPADAVVDKSHNERIPYADYIEAGKCFPCGTRTVDYGFIEKKLLEIEETYDVTVRGFGYDLYNCISTAQKLESAGYDAIEVIQHSKILHAPTKWLKECILNTKFHYEENTLFEINFQNAKVVEDTNKNEYVNKKKSNGKIDMLASLINAIYLMQQELHLNPAEDWGIQT